MSHKITMRRIPSMIDLLRQEYDQRTQSDDESHKRRRRWYWTLYAIFVFALVGSALPAIIHRIAH